MVKCLRQDSMYWDEEKKTFGYFEVEVTNTETFPAFISRTMRIHHIKVAQLITIL